MTFWYMYKLIYRKFEKRWADAFQIYPNAIHFNPLQFCPSMSLLGFPVFCWSSSTVLSRYWVDILVNSMIIWSVLKLPWNCLKLRDLAPLSDHTIGKPRYFVSMIKTLRLRGSKVRTRVLVLRCFLQPAELWLVTQHKVRYHFKICTT